MPIGRHLKTGGVELDDELLGVHAVNIDRYHAGQTVGLRVVAHGGVNAWMGRECGVELVGKGLQLLALLSHVGRQRRGGSGKGQLRAQVLRAGTTSGFLSSAKDAGAQRRAAF